MIRDLSDEQLLAQLHDAAALAELPSQIASSPELQQAIAAIMEAGEDAADSLEQLNADQAAWRISRCSQRLRR